MLDLCYVNFKDSSYIPNFTVDFEYCFIQKKRGRASASGFQILFEENLQHFLYTGLKEKNNVIVKLSRQHTRRQLTRHQAVFDAN
jgi:hypothetical protein